MTAYALLNAAFKLVDGLPAAAVEWIGGHAGAQGVDADRLGGAVTAGIGRMSALRVGSLRTGGTRPPP